MSLDTLNEKPPEIKEGTGYVVLELVSDRNNWGTFKLVPPNTEETRKTEMPGNELCNANLKNTLTCNLPQIGDKKGVHATYKSGFHVWKNEEDAEEHLGWMLIMLAGTGTSLALHKVQYYGAFAEGLIEDRPVVITKQMQIHVHVEGYIYADDDEDDDDEFDFDFEDDEDY